MDSSAASRPPRVASGGAPALVLLALGLLLVAAPRSAAQESAAQERAAEERAGEAPASRVSLAEDGPPRTAADEATLERLEDVLSALERLRGRDFEDAVVIGFYDRDQLRDYLQRALLTLVPPERLRAQGRALIAFGLLPPGTDLVEVTLDALTVGVGGFYDWERVRLYCMTSGLGALNQFVMIHEGMHALQDQSTSLEDFALTPELMEHDDRSVARSSVVEGEAMLVTSQVLERYAFELFDADDFDAGGMAEAFMQQVAMSQGIPPVIQDGMTFPYTMGEAFVGAVQDAGGWRAVDELYRDPPVSTEQIIHPQAYLAERRDVPLPVVAPDVAASLSAGWGALYANVFGELGTRQLVQFTGEPTDTFRASYGWGGDAYRVYAHADEDRADVLQWLWVGDTEQDAIELVQALARVTERQLAGRDDLTIDTGGLPDELVVTDGEGVARELLLRDDAFVLWLRGLPDGADVDALVARCMP